MGTLKLNQEILIKGVGKVKLDKISTNLIGEKYFHYSFTTDKTEKKAVSSKPLNVTLIKKSVWL